MSVKAWELPSLLSVPGEELDKSEYAVTISPDDPADFPRDLCIVNDICFTITNCGRVIGNSFKNKVSPRKIKLINLQKCSVPFEPSQGLALWVG